MPLLAESLCCLVRDPEAKGEWVGGGGSLDSWACTEVSICFLALMDKVPSSLLDCQLKGKRKLGVRQKNDSTHFRYLK